MRLFIASAHPTHFPLLIQEAQANQWGLRKIYRSGYRYQKAGVMLHEPVSANHRQADLFGSIATENKSNQSMDVID
jgi:DNA polymerase V